MPSEKIKQCPYCQTWFSSEDLIENQDIVPIGMKLNDEDLSLNFFFFNHLNPDCKTTFTIHVDEFKSYIDEFIPEENNAGKESCEGHCTNLDDLYPCSQRCHWAPFRQFLLSILKKRLDNNKEKQEI